MHERYREYAPAPALRQYVACYWSSHAPASTATHRVLPDGCIDILYNTLPGVYCHGAVVGTMTRPWLVRLDAPTSFVAVRFRPGGAVPFLPCPADEVTDAHADLSADWEADALAERLRVEQDDDAKVRLIESALLARLRAQGRVEIDARVRGAVSLFERTTLSVDAIAAKVEVSRQHLVRLFRRHVGVSPKQFARVARMQRLRSSLHDGSSPDWTIAALAAGYCDQAHMIGECRILTGLTPTELLATE